MSNAGRGKPNLPKIPGMMMHNGNSDFVPPDLVWDENDPPKIFPCSQHITHSPRCDGKCCIEPMTIDTELQVDLLNEARAYARAGMSFKGVPEAYANSIPIPGMQVELFDMLIWLQTLAEVVAEAGLIGKDDLNEKFRANKLVIMREQRDRHEAQVRKSAIANKFGIVEKPPLLGPDGTPL